MVAQQESVIRAFEVWNHKGGCEDSENVHMLDSLLSIATEHQEQGALMLSMSQCPDASNNQR